MSAPLLIELFTEELPPKALRRLGEAFAHSLVQSLNKAQLAPVGVPFQAFATPRRLAVRIAQVLTQAPEQTFREKLMPVAVGIAPDGQASPALLKKLQTKGLAHLSVEQLQCESDGKQDYLFATGSAAGQRLSDVLPTAVQHAIDTLPIPKVMRYQLGDGRTSVKFVRPVHGIVSLHGDQVIPLQALGITADRISHGHRFMGKIDISLPHADHYENLLLSEGKVIAHFDDRLHNIREQLNTQAQALGLHIGQGPEVDALLEEVCALVEFPKVYVGQFDEKFLSVPPECLILTMRLNQKYFPLFNTDGQLSHRFLIVSNMDVADPQPIIEGNERVVRPRLADAEFFFQTDRKIPLADRVPLLDNIVYHNKLGTQGQRVQRVRTLARYIAEQLGANVEQADRAALLAKADLTSQMVGEFPELQGIIGAYYARADQEDPAVAQAIADQYCVRFEQPLHSDNLCSAVLFLAERLETLVGIWGIGLLPTGERDPFALRRAALGIISVYDAIKASDITTDIPLPTLLAQAAQGLTQAGITLAPDTLPQVQQFIMERLRNQLQQSHPRAVVDAVLAKQVPLTQVLDRIQALTLFATLPEATGLAAANKRISNLLKKVDTTLPEWQSHLLQEDAEKALADCLTRMAPQVAQQVANGDFTQALQTLASSHDAVDNFFTHVMVMAEDLQVRQNRLALLSQLHHTMNQVADLALLAT